MTLLVLERSINHGTAVIARLSNYIAGALGAASFSANTFEIEKMAGTLVALGKLFALAISVTAIYLVLNLAIGLTHGFYFNRKYITSQLCAARRVQKVLAIPLPPFIGTDKVCGMPHSASYQGAREAR